MLTNTGIVAGGGDRSESTTGTSGKKLRIPHTLGGYVGCDDTRVEVLYLQDGTIMPKTATRNIEALKSLVGRIVFLSAANEDRTVVLGYRGVLTEGGAGSFYLVEM